MNQRTYERIVAEARGERSPQDDLVQTLERTIAAQQRKIQQLTEVLGLTRDYADLQRDIRISTVSVLRDTAALCEVDSPARVALDRALAILENRNTRLAQRHAGLLEWPAALADILAADQRRCRRVRSAAVRGRTRLDAVQFFEAASLESVHVGL